MIIGKCAKFFKNMRTCNSKSMACDASFFIWTKLHLHGDASEMQPELGSTVNLSEQDNIFLWWNQVTRRCTAWLWSWSVWMLASLSNNQSCWACASRSGWIANKMQLLQEHTSLLQQVVVQLWILATGKWRIIFLRFKVFYPLLSSINLRLKCRDFLSWRKTSIFLSCLLWNCDLLLSRGCL